MSETAEHSRVFSRYFSEAPATGGGFTLVQEFPTDSTGNKITLVKSVAEEIRKLPGQVTVVDVRYPHDEIQDNATSRDREDWDKVVEIQHGDNTYHISGEGPLELADAQLLTASVEATICADGLALNIIRLRGIIERPDRRSPIFEHEMLSAPEIGNRQLVESLT